MAVLSSPIQLVQSIPLVTRALTIATIACSGFYAWLCYQDMANTAERYMLLLPGSSLFAPWTLLTSAFVEPSIPEFVASMVFVPAALKYLERLWGTVETIKFILVSIVASNIIAFGFNWIEFIATGNAELFLYGMPYHGQMSLQIALLVAFTQLIPEHQVQVMGVIKTRVKSLPMAYLTLSTVLCILGWQCPWIIIQFGWFVGWVYLRFYKKNPGESVGGIDSYGDRSETFSLVSWFPPFLHGPLTILGNFVYKSANRFHLIPASPGGDIESGIYNQIPLSARAEAERRRALALKALDQHLANTSPAASSSSNITSQAPRPPTISQSKSENTSPSTGASPHANGHAHDRKKSVSEGDGGEAVAKSESQ